jgi:hypothetical protein
LIAAANLQPKRANGIWCPSPLIELANDRVDATDPRRPSGPSHARLQFSVNEIDPSAGAHPSRVASALEAADDRQKEMGAGIAASPHCAERRICRCS